MMTVRDAAEALNVSEKFVYSICQKGLLESFKVGNRIRITQDGLNRYLEGQKNGVAAVTTTPRRLTLNRLRLR